MLFIGKVLIIFTAIAAIIGLLLGPFAVLGVTLLYFKNQKKIDEAENVDQIVIYIEKSESNDSPTED